MEHKTLDATTTVVDQELGEFKALVSAWDADREGDTITLTAFDKTTAAWRESGKRLPLLWEHSTEVVGHVDPHSLRAVEDGLVAKGQIDRETDRGEAAWKMIKNDVAGFSIGFLAESRKRADGGRELFEVDLLEISVTSRPMNAATRALSWKSASDHDPLPEFAALMASFDVDRYREKASEPAIKSTGPVRVATFDC